MERQKLSTIAHGRHPIAAPLSDASVRDLIEQLQLPPGASVIDVGCGPAEWLIRILERYDVTGVGVDLSPAVLQRAREEAERRGVADRITFREENAERLRDVYEVHDLVLCIGSTHALGGLVKAMETLHCLVKPGGQLVVGDGFWERTPDATAVNLFGGDPDHYFNFGITIDHCSSSGLTPLHAHASTQTEWDEYEWSWIGSIRRYVREHPDDPDAEELWEAAYDHGQEYLHGYRGTLGFVTCLLTKYE